MTEYTLEFNKTVITATYSKGGGLKKLIAKKGFLVDVTKAGYVFSMLERDIELEHWKKNETVPDPFFSPAQKAWFEFYKKRSGGLDYRFTPIDGKALKEIGVYLTAICGVTHNAVDIWKHMLQKWDTLDPFYRHKMQLSFINTNLNTLLNLLKNGKQTSKATPRSAADDLRRGFQ